MSGVRDYEYKELHSAGAHDVGGKNGGVKEFQAPVFEVHATQKVAEVSSKRIQNFKLDSNVASQLGLERQQQEAFEARVQAEIERRWQIAKEKAEVEGYTAGLNEGKNEAYKAELPRIQEKLQKLEALLQEFDSMRSRIFQANESFLMDIIAQVARMVVLKEVEADREYLHRVVTALLHQLGTKDDLKITISEQDAQLIETLRQALEKEFGKLNNTSIETSSAIAPGGCKIETRFGVVDASLPVQVENVMRSLKN